MSSQCTYSDNKANITTDGPQNGDVLDSKRLNFEEERLKTFAAWPVQYPVGPDRLAKAGFYYTGTEDEVVCFSCHGRIKNWNYGDIVFEKHSSLYPKCDFVRNVSNNVPLLKTSTVSKLQSCSPTNYSDVIYKEMKSENERLKTFIGKWPLSNEIIAELAHAGYFYTGIDDKVQCAFCKIIVGNLKARNGYREHLTHYPGCDYLSHKSKDHTTKAKNEILWYQTSSQDVCGNMKPNNSCSGDASLANKFISNNQQNVDLEDLGVFLHKQPIHPYYASLTARLSTFSSWPSDAPISKEDMAAAGFFYHGIGDATVCFHCNGGLKKWEKGDDPWVEHARWFYGCEFVRLNKGSDFMIACLLKTVTPFLNENRDISSHFDTSESLLKKLDEAMKSNLVKNLAESGLFPLYILRAAILSQIKQTGSSFSNSDDLGVAASFLKEKIEEQYLNEKPVKAEDLNICLKISKNLTISDASQDLNKAEPVPSHSLDISEECNVNKGESHVSGDMSLQNTPKDSSEKPTVSFDGKEDHYLCPICMDRERGVVFLPCGHLPACTICAPALKDCPLCRKPIQATLRCYFH